MKRKKAAGPNPKASKKNETFAPPCPEKHDAKSSDNIPGWLLPAGKFLLGFCALFLAINFALSLLPLQDAENFFATGANAVVGALGIHGNVVPQEPVLINIEGIARPIGISYLCTGLLEIAVICAAVLASFGIRLRQRAIGAAAGAAIVVLFNFARIIAGILAIKFLGLEAAAFAHDIMFRAFLFIVIAGYYYAWFGWATAEASAGSLSPLRSDGDLRSA
ncbi:Uncharacterised protein [uncultured archaeon]|nr:Uncharacterised protein [uncultured archaeon]